jgi:hypothetical protein
MMDDRARVFADEIVLKLFDGGGAGFGAAFDDRLAEADDAGVGVDFEEQPAGFDEDGFELGDGQFFPTPTSSRARRRPMDPSPGTRGETGGCWASDSCNEQMAAVPAAVPSSERRNERRCRSEREWCGMVEFKV